jgi:hypothetical protein
MATIGNYELPSDETFDYFVVDTVFDLVIAKVMVPSFAEKIADMRNKDTDPGESPDRKRFIVIDDTGETI